MMIHFVLCTLIESLLLASAGGATPGLLHPGRFHGAEVQIQNGEIWWGMFASDSTSALRKVTLQIEPVQDQVLDKPGQKTGKRIFVDGELQPLFLVKNLRRMRIKKPVTIARSALLMPKSTHEFELHGRRHNLQARGSQRAIRLELSTGDTTQVLFDRELDEGLLQILWVGDIDGDGGLDYYVDFAYKYSVSRRMLWLSSLAKPGELVGLFALLHTTPGC